MWTLRTGPLRGADYPGRQLQVSPRLIFEEFGRSGWTPRHPATEAELARLNSSLARGTCLNPVIFDGDALYIDPDAQPEDGDIISFELSDHAAATEPSAAGGRTSWAKLLIELDGERWLVENQGMIRFDGFVKRVYGVVRAIRRGRGEFLAGAAVVGAYASQIGLGAATETTTAYNASHTAVNNFGADTTWLTITTPAQAVDHTIQVTASMDVWKAASTPQRTVELFAVPSPGGPPFYGSAVRDIVFTAAPGERVALQADFPALADTQYIVRVALASPGGGTGNTEVRDATLRTEHIKR